MIIFINIVCQGFVFKSRLKTVRTPSGHLGWDGTVSGRGQLLAVPRVIAAAASEPKADERGSSEALIDRILL